MVQPLAPISILAPAFVEFESPVGFKEFKAFAPPIGISAPAFVTLTPVQARLDNRDLSITIKGDSNVELGVTAAKVTGIPAIELEAPANVELEATSASFDLPAIDIDQPQSVELTPVVASFQLRPVVVDAPTVVELEATSASLSAENLVVDAPASVELEVALADLQIPTIEVDTGARVELTPVSATLGSPDVAVAAPAQLELAPTSATLQAQLELEAPASVALEPTTGDLAAPSIEVSTGTRVELTPVVVRLQTAEPALSAPALVAITPVSVGAAAVDVSLLAPAVVTLEPVSTLAALPEIEISDDSAGLVTLTPVVANFNLPQLGDLVQVTLMPVVFQVEVPKPTLTGVWSARDLIYCELVESVRDGPFYAVVYNPNTRKSTTGPQIEVEAVTILGNEQDSEFDTAARHRRTFRDERQEWRWLMVLTFNREVTIEHFERMWIDKIKIIEPRNGEPKVFLRLERSDYDHPVQQQGNQGTEARLTFRADLAPV